MPEQPKYQILADRLRKEIAEGVFRDGQALMTEEELRLRFGVSRQTVRQAIALLEDDGLVDRRRGSGTYVRHGPRKRQGLLRVGVLTSYITDYISPSILGGIEAVMTASGAIMNLSATGNDPRMERSILERMMDGQVDGLIVEGCRSAEETPNRDCFLRLAERNIPVLFMNGFYRNLPSFPYVVMDDYAGGRMAARELVKRGYRSPGGVFKTDDLQGAERARGFLDELTEQGIPVPVEHLLYFGTEQRYTLFDTDRGVAFAKRLGEPDGMDSVACYNDIFAVNLMMALGERGLISPEKIGIIGFDDAPVAAVSHPALTTLGHPKEVFGERAAEKLLRMLDGGREKSEKLSWTMIERESLPEKRA